MDEWKDIYFIDNGIIYDYIGIYQINRSGQIKNIIRGKILKNSEDVNGYERCSLYKNGNKKQFMVHRIVAHIFCKGYFDGAEVDHINTVRNDNRFENLKWVKREENLNNPLTKKNYSESRKGDRNPNFGNKDISNILSKSFIGVNIENKTTLLFLSSASSSKKYGFIPTHIIQCSQINLLGYENYIKTHKTTRKTSIHKGYDWFYKEDYIKKFGEIEHE